MDESTIDGVNVLALVMKETAGKKGKKEKHLEPSINSSDIFFPLPRKKTSIRSLTDIRRRVLQKIYCSNCKRNLLLQLKT